MIESKSRSWTRKTTTNHKHKRGQKMKENESWITSVKPIKDDAVISRLLDELSKNKKLGLRNKTIAIVGFNTGMRISDILNLKVTTLFDDNGHMVDNFRNVDIKTNHTRSNNKAHDVFLTPKTKEALQLYLKKRGNRSQWLFPSSKNHRKPLSRVQFASILNQAAAHAGIPDVNTHTLRKTFGYRFYKQTGDIVTLQHILNHTSISVTRHYIGLDDEEMQKKMNRFHDISL
ncbi:tyrosine-type recombinase/integrase [Ligilactobacillus sp. LYQ139]